MANVSGVLLSYTNTRVKRVTVSIAVIFPRGRHNDSLTGP